MAEKLWSFFDSHILIAQTSALYIVTLDKYLLNGYYI